MSYYSPPPGGGIGGFPKTVAVANYSAQSVTHTFDLLDSSLATGDYVLNDYLSASATGDNSANFTSYVVSWADESGAQSLTSNFPLNNGNGFGSIAGLLALNALGDPIPATIHAVTGTPIAVQLNIVPSGVGGATVTALNAGLLYAPGDTGLITTGGGNAIYHVLTVGAGGAVLTVSITQIGDHYTVSNGNATSVTTGSGNGSLKLDITSLTTNVVYNYHATLVRTQ